MTEDEAAELRALQRRAYGSGAAALSDEEATRLSHLQSGATAQTDDRASDVDRITPVRDTAPLQPPTPTVPVTADPAVERRKPHPGVLAAMGAGVLVLGLIGGWFLHATTDRESSPRDTQRAVITEALVANGEASGMTADSVTYVGSTSFGDIWAAHDAAHATVCAASIPLSEHADETDSGDQLTPSGVEMTCLAAEFDIVVQDARLDLMGPTGANTVVQLGARISWPAGGRPALFVAIDEVSGSSQSLPMLGQLTDLMGPDVAANAPDDADPHIALVGMYGDTAIWTLTEHDGTRCAVLARMDPVSGAVATTLSGCGSPDTMSIEIAAPNKLQVDATTGILVLDTTGLAGYGLSLVWDDDGNATVALRPS